jgi:hypothetical protein
MPLQKGLYQNKKRERALALSLFNSHSHNAVQSGMNVKLGQPSPVLQQMQMQPYHERPGRPTHDGQAQYWLS